jgi:arylsulfatase A
MKQLYFLLLLGGSALAQTPQRPNIIHIMMDDVGQDDLSCYGAKDIRTPNLDRVAAEGTRFTNFYAPHGTCTPSRAAVLTGRYARRVNDHTGLSVLFPSDTIGLDPRREITVGTLLRQQGYRTAVIGKWHLGHLPKFLPPNQGFDEFFGIPYPNDHGPERDGNTGARNFPPIALIRGTQTIKGLTNTELAEVPQAFVREACRFIRENATQKRPFYLQFSNIETHTPWFIPAGWAGQSKAGTFGDAVEYFDATLGVLMKQLKTAGIDQNTLVVITADNGPLVYRYPELEACYGQYARVDTTRKHRLRDGKYQEAFENGTRVACLMRWPDAVPVSQVSEQIITGCDLFTTFVQLAGAKLPTDRVIDGKSLLDLWRNPLGPAIRNTFFGIQGRGTVASVRYYNWKYIVADKNRPAMLFDLARDEGERTDVARQNPGVVRQLSALASQAAEALLTDKPLPETNQLTF